MDSIEGQLLPGMNVLLDSRTASYGGSWIPGSGSPLLSYNQDIIGTFFNIIRVRNPLLVLDVGANTGSFLLLAKFIPGMVCIGFEPVPEIWDILLSNVRLNGLEQRVPIADPLALSDYVGTGKLHVPDNPVDGGLACMDDIPPVVASHTIDVPVKMIDSLNLSRCDAIKLDVERNEARTLKGARETLMKFKPIVLLEKTRPEETVPILKSFGYRIIDYDTDILAMPVAE